MASQGRISHCLVILSCLVISPFFCVAISHAADTLRDGQVMRDWEFLESSNKLFRLLFFSLGVSSNRYLGIQYMNFSLWSENGNQKKMVWVANRDSPLKDSSGVLNITQDGNLVIDYNGTFIAINSEQPAKSSNTSVTILDSGNLVLRAGEHILWQSFDYPSDTWLPGMKLGLFELNTGQPRQQFLTSWVSTQVPTVGAFTLGVDPNNTRQIIVWQRGVLYWHSGMWNGYNFSHFPDMPELFNPISFSYFMNENESYFTYTRNGNNLSSWIQIDSSGEIDIFESNEDGWMLDETGHCDAKQVDDRSKGCVTLEPSNCTGGDVFNQTSGTMDMWDYMSNFSQGLTDCKEICLRDCSCNAYASALSDGSGCKFSNGQKVDYLVGEEFFYIRNSTLVEKNTPIPTTKDYANNTPPESPNNVHPDRPRKSQLWLTIAGPLAALIVLVPVSLLCYLRWRNHCFGGRNGSSKDGMSQGTQLLMYESSSGIAAAINEFSDAQKLEFIGKKDPELPLFSFPIIQMATDHFSHANKIGQGGFGPVYKGKLDNGQEIAVKRLSRSSGQGSEEFKNEVILISKLQHRNLVRLLGYCMQGEERILLYEYMPNKSLDSFLFDATKQALLDWKKRVHIIEGIAQGLLYLHKYSRLTIIHRDLKTSNVLLDCKMNPKISDFGTARIFGENESRASTNRIVGTYGYMSPEYAMDGLFSVKSDVFSFGVMLLEIISGKKNTGFYQSDRCLNLLGYAWDLWKEGRGLELIDPALAETCLTSEVMRYAQVGLLCVQESAADRPTMADVVSMLSNELMVLPAPKQPAFSAIVSVNNADLSKNTEPCSINDVTISRVDGR